MVHGLVGDGAGVEFMAFLQQHQKLPPVELILDRKAPIEIPMQPDLKFAFCSALVDKLWRYEADSARLQRFFDVMFELSSDFATMTLLDAMSHADDEALTPLLQMVPMQTSGRDLHPAMLVLHKALALGVDINQIWTLRNTLNINHCKDRPRCSIFAQNSQAKSGENGPSHWRWKVTGDGCTEVWRIDFILWAQALEAGVTHAKQMRSLVGQSIGANEYACQAAAYVLQNHADILSTSNWLQLLKQTYKIRKRDGHCDLFKLRARCMEKSRRPERFPNHLIDYALDPLNASNVPLHTRYLKLALASHAKELD